jgi:choline dehydrogenase
LFSAESVGQKLHPFPGFLASVCQLRPRSRGSVAIKSADPAAAPAILLRYMSDPFDQEVIVAGMKLSR